VGEQLPGPVDVKQERTELVADPVRAVGDPHHRLDVEVGAGQYAVRPGQGERHPTVRIGQRDATHDVDRAGREVRRQPLDA
jgi:hypothetical protein